MREKNQNDKLRVEAFKLRLFSQSLEFTLIYSLNSSREQFLCRAIRVLNVGFRVFRSPKLIALRRKISWH